MMMKMIIFLLQLGTISNVYADADLKRQMQEAQALPSTIENELTVSRLALRLFQLTTLEKEEEKYLEIGRKAARKVYDQDPKNIDAIMLLVTHDGYWADSHWFQAPGIIKNLELWLKEAKAIDATYDHAAPDRALGILYLEVPSFLIGSIPQAREHLNAMWKHDTSYASNKLAWAKLLVNDKKPDEARKLVNEVKAVVEKPEHRFDKKAFLKSIKEIEKKL